MKYLQKFIIVGVLLLLLSCSPDKRNNDKPNIVFILVDDLGWRDVGFMGSTFYETPNIDRIAREGITFTNAYAACAVSSPSRASLLTGRYPTRTGITDWIRGSYSGASVPVDKKNPVGYDTVSTRKLLTPKNPLWMEHSEITIAEILKLQGYTTGHIGKWHLGFDEWYPEKQGFDINVGGTDLGQPPSYFDPYESGKYNIKNLLGNKTGEYLTDREGDEAVKFITANKHKPFFLHLSHYAVHTPLQAKDSLISKYQSKSKNDPSIKEWINERDDYIARFRSREPLDGQRNPTYAAMIQSVDEAVGKVLNTLDELGIGENTFVVFYSDNGGHIVSTDNAPAKLGKGHSSEGGIRVPLAIRWPEKISAEKAVNDLVMGIDFLPTFCSIVNSKIPENKIIDGIDLSPLLFENQKLERTELFWHFPHYWWGQKVRPYSIIRSGDWKLIYNWEDENFELYNLKNDFSEHNNLANLNSERVKQLNTRLNEWLEKTNAKKPLKNPKYNNN